MKCPVCGMETGVFMSEVVVIHKSCYDGFMDYVKDLKRRAARKDKKAISSSGRESKKKG
jgi:hypothetical protein